MGMTAIETLWKYVMKYSPNNPECFNRGRFVLSNGHTCPFQYTFLHLTGSCYKHTTFEQLKTYHSTSYDSFCPGHPEIEHQGIEVTTAPLGQGIANTVDLAMATKHLAAVYSKPGFDLINNTTWCMIGETRLQEGVVLEAIQLASHWKLSNLVVIEDNNQITCDRSVDLCNTEDVNTKMIACEWDVIDAEDGCFDVEALVKALSQAKASEENPTFINVHTIIGIGSRIASDAQSHGTAFGGESVKLLKKLEELGLNPEEHFVVSDKVYGFFENMRVRGDLFEEEWAGMVRRYAQEHPELHEEVSARVRSDFTEDWSQLIPAKVSFPTIPTASRKSAGLICNPRPYTSRLLTRLAQVKMARLTAHRFGKSLPIHAKHTLHSPLRYGKNHRCFHNSYESQKCPDYHSLSRQSLEQYPQYSSCDGLQKGAYVFIEESNADVTLTGVGSERCFAVKTREIPKDKYSI
ncbi:hypothetical protein HIM_01303 [Hirsutella minnesotensis 3608]|nr:hypothetical protein HIM_01303 [Hirsutella minnesotensis 3608]